MRAKLYSLSLSHPSRAAKGMLDRKGLEYELVNLLPGPHAILLRLAGFPGWTVPALKLDGRRVQGSRAISRALDELKPEPALFPPPPRRRAVEEAERWGEEELQSVPRRIFRWALAHDQGLRRWMGAEVVGVPAPELAAALNAPVASAFARRSGADDARVRADLARLPGLLERVAGLIAEGTIGGEAPNAADFQIGSSVRLLMELGDLRRVVEGGPPAELAMRLFPEHPGPIPAALPPEWLTSISR